MEAHQICEEVIARFHGQPIGEEGNKLQIRYADTDEQKKLKSLTTERRQFKTHEYNSVVFGGASPYQYPSPTSDGFSTNYTTHIHGPPPNWMTQPSISPRYGTFTNQSLCRHTDVFCESIASQSSSLVNGIRPSLSIPGYVVPLHSRPVPRESYIVDSPSVKRAIQEKPIPECMVKISEPTSKTGNIVPSVTVHEDGCSSPTSSA